MMRLRNVCLSLGLVLCVVLTFGGEAFAQSVKKSSSGICHCPGGTYYNRTKSFTAFDTLNACLSSGGREPARGQGQCLGSGRAPLVSEQPNVSARVPSQSGERVSGRAPIAYDRDAFGGWADSDGDCLDTRAEVLSQLSTGTVAMRSNQCAVDRGRWNDPYTGRIFMDAGDLDVDHLVPLSWAWHRGAWSWTSERRRQFANDMVNLFAVQNSVNRQKGDSGPLEWLPPNASFHCEYVTRFERVRRTYGLEGSAQEMQAMQAQRAQLCGR